MRESIYLSQAGNYFLLRATVPHSENVVVTVFCVTDLEWAAGVGPGPVAEPTFGWEAVAEPEPYLRVDVWAKYFFPTFGSEPVGQGHAYQWYSLDDAAELHELLAACVQAAATHGVVLGSR